MLKRLAVLVGLFVVLVAAIVLVTCKYQDSSQESQSSREKNSLPTAIPPTQRDNTQDYAQGSDPKPRCWHILLAWPVGITTWGILATLLIIGWQSWETSNSAQAARASITMQETLNQQWVEITGWRKEGFGSRELDPPQYTIAAEIRNPTRAPLTLKTVHIGVPGAIATYEYDSVLAPIGEPAKVTYSGEINPTGLSAYNIGQYPIVIEGTITYIDCFKKGQTQPFRRGCFLGPKSQFYSVAISELQHPISKT